MTFYVLNKAILRGGISIAAALMLSTAAFAQDAAADDATTDPATSVTVVQNWHDLNPGAIDAIAVGEPDPSGDGAATDPTDDPVGDATGGDDGSDPVVVADDGACTDADCTPADATDPTEGGTIVIYTMDGGLDACIDCNTAGPVGTVQPGRGITGSEVERNLTHAPNIQTAAASARSGGSDVANVPAAMSMTQCLGLHPRSSWICEWQTGASQ